MGYQYGSLVQADLDRWQNTELTYGRWFIEEKEETFQIWSNHLPTNVVYRDNIKIQLLIMPARFWAMHYINDDGYTPVNEAPKLERVKNLRKTNMEVYQTCSRERPADIQFHRILVIWPFQNIHGAQELHCDYESSFVCDTYPI